MSTFEIELRACLGEVLGEEPPVPDTEALLFFKQWLAERNLGLVPIADAATFEWPGHWLARVRTTEGDHAVLMFGAPSGALFDPAGAMSDGGTIEAGWLVAPLDLRRGDDQIAADGPGSVAGLLVAPETLDELNVSWERARRNVVTRGVSLNPLVGRRFRIGDVECIGRRLCEPCAHLEKVSGAGLLRPLVHRGGLRADILAGGTIELGDELVP